MSKKKYIKTWDQYSFFRKLWYRIVYLFSKNKVPKAARKYLTEQYSCMKAKLARIFGLAEAKAKPIINRTIKNEDFKDASDYQKYGTKNALTNIVKLGMKSISDERAYQSSIRTAVETIEMADSNDRKQLIDDLSSVISSNDTVKSETEVKNDIIATMVANKQEPVQVVKKKKKKKKHHSTEEQKDDSKIHIHLNIGPGDGKDSIVIGNKDATNIIDNIKRAYDAMVQLDNNTDDCNKYIEGPKEPNFEIKDGCIVMHRIKKKPILCS